MLRNRKSRQLMIRLLFLGLVASTVAAAEPSAESTAPRRRPTRLADRGIMFEAELPRPRVHRIETAEVPGSSAVTQASHTWAVECQPPCGCRHFPCWHRLKSWFHTDRTVPFGASVQAHVDTQIAAGIAATLVLYRYDFHDVNDADPSSLNRFGERRLRMLIPRLQSCSCPLIVEPEPDHPEVSEARRLNVLQRISTEACVPISDQRVIVAEAPAAGLSGVEAAEIDQTLLEQTRQRGGEAVQGRARRSFGTTLDTSSNQTR